MITIRSAERGDFASWLPLWHGYNAFYGRSGPTALPEEITRATWERFFDPAEPMHALVATLDGRVVALAHYLFHRSTTALLPTCYLQDLFTDPQWRSRGVAAALIDEVCARAKAAGSARVYWQTKASNATARRLYDRVAGPAEFVVYRKLL